jgi:Carboxypeptidase regulatory-like domain/TonB dependent receptor
MKYVRTFVLAAIVVSSHCHAQVDRSGVSGTVTDPEGRVLPGTHIIVIQNSTQSKRETVSQSKGNYTLPGLPVGVYTVTFAHTGFKNVIYLDVEEVIGRTRTLNATLSVSGGEQRIEVSASSEQMDTGTDALGGRIEKAQAQELPLNGRNWATLTALVPGAVDTGGSNQRSIRFAGRGRDDDNFTYDGIDANNIINQAQQPYVRLSIPLDTIEEFRIDAMLATAEGGQTGGPQLAVTSPSGTNQWHGNVFEYLRNNIFDAKQPVPVTTTPAPPFHLNQFGGSLGGPIVPSKTFFFLAYEGYRQRWGFPLSGLVPSSTFRAQVLKDSPALAAIVNAYPSGQFSTSNQNVNQFTSEGTQAVNENSAMVRFDQHFSEKTTGFLRFNFDRAANMQPLASSGQYLSDQQQLTSAPLNGGLELMHVFSPSLLNEVKFGFNRSTANTIDINQTGLPYAVSVAGFTTLNNNRVSIGAGNTFSEIDNLTWTRGRHMVKAGVEIRRVQLNQGNTEAGTIAFASTAAFDANQVSTATLNGTLPVNGLRKTQYYGYIQDEFKWKPNLTLNLGLRYSFFNIFHEVLSRANPFDFATCGPHGFCGMGASFGQPNYRDVDPRVAFAWSPAKDGKTVLRAGFGIYHEDGQLDDQNLPISNEVFAYSLSSKTTPNLSYPIDPFLANTQGIISPRDDDRLRKDTYVEQWGFSVQRALPADFVSTLSYVGSKGVHLLTLSDVNMVNPLTGTRPYAGFGQVSWRGNTDGSDYEGFSTAVKRSFSRGLLLSANYMWSHEIDDGSNGSGDGDSLVPQNVACPACERASGIWDARHVLNANGVYELPFGPNKPFLNERGVIGNIVGSWEMTSMVIARTGFPVNVTVNRSATSVPDGNTSDQRPDLVPGVSLTPPGGKSIGQWINPAAFAMPANGTFGNAPRDIARGPGAWQMDFGVIKHILLTESTRLEFRSEFFNVFNHPQFGLPQSTFGVQGFGSIIQTVNTTTPVSPVGAGTPREIQFALKLKF